MHVQMSNSQQDVFCPSQMQRHSPGFVQSTSWSGRRTLESHGLRLSQPACLWYKDLFQGCLEFFLENCRGFTFQEECKEAFGRMVLENQMSF